MNFQEAFTLDRETGRLFWKAPPKNHAQRRGDEAGFLCPGKGKNKTYWHIRVFGKTFKRSRIVFHMTHGRWPEPAVDHSNGDSLDDRPSNLRECTLSQNAANSRPRNRPLPKGVTRTRQGGFMARITQNGKTVSLGVYGTPTDAFAAYEAAKREVFREFA